MYVYIIVQANRMYSEGAHSALRCPEVTQIMPQNAAFLASLHMKKLDPPKCEHGGCLEPND
jgi:hypothetical protein